MVALVLTFTAIGAHKTLAENSSWIEKTYKICVSLDQDMKQASVDFIEMGLIPATLEDVSEIGRIAAQARTIGYLNPTSISAEIKKQFAENKSKMVPMIGNYIASGVPVFWLDEKKQTVIIAETPWRPKNSQLTCQIHTNDVSLLKGFIKQIEARKFNDKVLGGTADRKFAIVKLVYPESPAKDSQASIKSLWLTIVGVSRFEKLFGETRATMFIRQMPRRKVSQ
ncbi:MAG: hypothetical protein GXP03_07325 [Alphaproteobacteria bacterium]|nr:hypothetical protein [Alphaproteobacteria bacterium]